ncbi:hypothetical protein ERJ77_23395, partial [Vibrio anguillarum]|nr:hypothetical protein [Vibrio anguillarum]
MCEKPNHASIDYIKSYQAASGDHLKIVKCELASEDIVNWAREFFKEKQCFSNALNMSIVDGCDYVLGYIYFECLGIAIEHAWNCDEQAHFDLTAQLFWEDSVS